MKLLHANMSRNPSKKEWKNGGELCSWQSNTRLLPHLVYLQPYLTLPSSTCQGSAVQRIPILGHWLRASYNSVQYEGHNSTSSFPSSIAEILLQAGRKSSYATLINQPSPQSHHSSRPHHGQNCSLHISIHFVSFTSTFHPSPIYFSLSFQL